MPQIVRDEQGVEHEFPDEATPEMIAQAMGVRLAAPAAPAAAPVAAQPQQEDGFLAALMSGAKKADNLIGYAAQEARRGVANVAGLPVDLASIPVNLGVAGVNKGLEAAGVDYRLPYADRPIGGSQSLFEATSGFGAIPEVAPQGPATKFAGRVAQEVGAMVLPFGGIRTAAGALGATGARELAATGSNAFKRAAAPLVEQAAADPAKYAAKELAAALGAGGGAATANLAMDAAGYDPDSTAYKFGDLTGSMAGLGTVGLAQLLSGYVGRGFKTLTDTYNYVNDVDRGAAVRQLAADAGVTPNEPGLGVNRYDALAQRIASGDRPGEVIPGYAETLSDRLPEPGLANREYVRSSGPNSAAFAARRESNTNAASDAMLNTAPTGDPATLLDAIQGGIRARVDDVTRMADEAALRADRVAQAVQPAMTPEGRGGLLRNDLRAAEEAAQDIVSQAYAKAGVDSLTFDPASLRAALNRVTESLPEAEKILVPSDLIDRVAKLGAPPDSVAQMFGDNVVWPVDPVSMREATALRSELLRRQRAALSDPRAERGGQNAARIIGDYLNAIEGVMSQALPPETRTAVDEARALARGRAETFGRQGSPVAAVLAQREGGRSNIPDSRVAAQFVDPNAGQPLDELLKAADTPNTRAAIRDEILSRAGANTGSAETVRGFLDQYAEPLKRFPQLREELLKVADERGTQQMAADQAAEVKDQLTRPSAGPVARMSQYAPESMTDAMSNVLRSPRAGDDMAQILGFVGNDKNAREGAKRAFWDALKRQGQSSGKTTRSLAGEQRWNPEAVLNFLDDPKVKAASEKLWADDPGQLTRIRDIADTLRSVNVAELSRAPGTSGTTQIQKGLDFLPSMEGLSSRLFAVERGVVSPQYAGLNILATTVRRAMKAQNAAAVENLVDSMILNPDFAEAMLRKYNPDNMRAASQAARMYLPNRVAHIVDATDPGEDEDPVVKALRPEKRP